MNLGDITFLVTNKYFFIKFLINIIIFWKEAFELTGFILNITVTGLEAHDRYRILNYYTAPNVIIWSASAASCGIPRIYGSTPIYM